MVSSMYRRLLFFGNLNLLLEKAVAPHSSTLAWRILGTGSLVGCRLWGCTESDTTEATQQQQQQQQHAICKIFAFFFAFNYLQSINVYLFKKFYFLSIYTSLLFFLAALGLHFCTGLYLIVERRGCSLVEGPSFALWWLLLLRSPGTRHAGFSSCDARTQFPCSI